ncbi:hypothetical protein TIFTF001_038373 [Ficus carica]|uniref:Uncharacterized protein n=1 Tax=Ficus carica TaxID=3494 RepID=A0AA88E7U4_FICCA|nr:hypothetical protein TIFTF001_038358 [Ficus carica]GMN69313.1 hypothetical protein TIFTF001_038365 [Ficus carica]GMN69316.1 hypothetical protein TIFTF001_038367 [Ficus carica]GMN69321.1 hypothetical protein TIFTF001_038373 [Ficus carica]
MMLSSPKEIPLPLSSHCDVVSTNPEPVVKESPCLLNALYGAHSNAATTLLNDSALVVKRLKDTNFAVRDACRDTIGALTGLYLNGGGMGRRQWWGCL